MCRPIERALHWRLWGVLLSGALNSLLFERGGEILQAHIALFIFSAIALPVIGGMLTPAKPSFTVLVFALGSVPPWNDVPPISNVLWPFYYLFPHENLRPLNRDEWIVGLLFTTTFAAVAVALMSIVYVPLVHIGYVIRVWRAKSDPKRTDRQ